MSDVKNVMQNIEFLHDLIVLQHRDKKNIPRIKRLNTLMSNLKGVGIIEGADFNGHKGRYLLIEGSSWFNACKLFKHNGVPNFVIWEENDFFSFLKEQITHSGTQRSRPAGK